MTLIAREVDQLEPEYKPHSNKEANFETWIEGLPTDERADFRAKFPLGAPYDQRLAATRQRHDA